MSLSSIIMLMAIVPHPMSAPLRGLSRSTSNSLPEALANRFAPLRRT